MKSKLVFILTLFFFTQSFGSPILKSCSQFYAHNLFTKNLKTFTISLSLKKLEAKLKKLNLKLVANDKIDIIELKKFLKISRQSTGMSDEKINQINDSDIDDIKSSYDRRNGYFITVMDSSDRIVGTLGFYPLSETTAEIKKFYLDPSFQGQGFGKTILRSLIAQAQFSGYTHLQLITHPEMQSAIKLYLAMGFNINPNFHLSHRPGVIMMTKIID